MFRERDRRGRGGEVARELLLQVIGHIPASWSETQTGWRSSMPGNILAPSRRSRRLPWLTQIRTLTFRASHACCTSGSYMEQGNRYDLRGLRFLHRCSAPTSDNYIIPAPKNSIMREMVTLNIFALQIFLVIQQIIACFIVCRASHSCSSHPNGVIAVVFVGGHLVGICLQQVFLAFMVCLHFVLL